MPHFADVAVRHKAAPRLPWLCGFDAKRALAPIQKAQSAIVLIVLLRGLLARLGGAISSCIMIMLTSVCTVGRPVSIT